MKGLLERLRTRPATSLWIVGVTALIVRVVAAIALDGLRHPHLEEYDVIARNMLAGQGFTYPFHGVAYQSFIAPLPAWIVAGSYWLAGSLVPAMLLQIVAGAALAPATAAVARRIFGGWVAPLAAGLLVACHPGLIVYSASRSHSLPYDSLFFMLALLQAVRLAERPTVARAGLLGCIVGVGVLSRATVLLALPVAAVWLMVVTPRAIRAVAIRGVVIAGLCAAAVIAPWTIRNSLLHGRFVLLITTDTENFWRGNNPIANGTSYTDATHTIFQALPVDEIHELESQPGELAQADWFRDRAWEFIKRHPDQFVRLALRKLFYFWWYSPETGRLYPGWWFQAYLAYYVTILMLAAMGVRMLVRSGGPSLLTGELIIAFVIVLSGFQSLYYVEGRHRWGIEAMLIALGSGAVSALLNSYRAVVSRGSWPRRPTVTKRLVP